MAGTIVVKVGSSQVPANPYVRVNGVWKRVIPWVRIAGVWQVAQ